MTVPNCRLYFVTPVAGDNGHISDCLHSAMLAGDVAALLVRAQTFAQLDERVRLLANIGQPSEIAILVDNEIECAKQAGADGVNVSGDLAVYHEARKVLGSEMIVGFNAGNARHLAMAAGEAGADYIAFDDDLSSPEPLALWWAGLFEIPCVALQPCGLQGAEDLAKAGVEFICPLDDVWQSPDHAGAMAKAYTSLFAKVAEQQ